MEERRRIADWKPHVKWLIERGESFPPPKWQERLGIDEAAWAGLLERDVFEPLSGGELHIRFVGLMALPHELFVVLPKFSSLPQPARALPDLHRTLAHYFARAHQRRAVRGDPQHEVWHRDDSAFTEYQLWLTLRAWYRAHGPYSRRERELGESWGKTVHWSRTLGRSMALHADEAAVYASPIMARSSDRINDVTRLQISVLARLEEKYVIEGEAPLDPAHRATHATLGPRLDTERQAWAIRVRQELDGAYRTDEIAMLSAVHEWLREERYGRRGPLAVRLFGTTRFEHVWEDACRVVLGNGPAIDMPAPVWTLDGRAPVPGSPPRPDLWAALPDGRRAVLDAKYYWPLPASLPGWGDVVKQLFYAKVCADEHALVNCFLFPDTGATDIVRRGQVDIHRSDGAVIDEFPPIQVCGVQPDALFARYVENLSSSEWLGVLNRAG